MIDSIDIGYPYKKYSCLFKSFLESDFFQGLLMHENATYFEKWYFGFGVLHN